MADVTIDEASKEEWDLIALPGGLPGADHLRDCPKLIEMLKKQQGEKKLTAGENVIWTAIAISQSRSRQYIVSPHVLVLTQYLSTNLWIFFYSVFF